MKNCNTCKHSTYTGWQEQKVKEYERPNLKAFCFKYCLDKKELVFKNELCENFKSI